MSNVSAANGIGGGDAFAQPLTQGTSVPPAIQQQLNESVESLMKQLHLSSNGNPDTGSHHHHGKGK